MLRKGLALLLVSVFLFGCRYTSKVPNDDFILCLTFDDSCASVWTNALPIMQEYGFRGTVFANSGRIGNQGRLTWAQLDSLKHTFGWEIGGHTLNHEALSTLTYEQARFTIATDYQNLQSHGLQPVSFATTFGYCPVEYYPLINSFYKNIRTCFNVSMRQPIERTCVGSFDVINSMSPDVAYGRIAQGMMERENLVVFLFHDISEQSTTYATSYHPEDFARLMHNIESRGIKVMPLSEALDYLD